MKKVALMLCFAFVGSMAINTVAVATSTMSDKTQKVVVDQEKPCPKDCKCDKCTKDKAACDKDKKECTKKENSSDKKCCKSGTANATDTKTSGTAKEATNEKTETKSADAEKK